jgi:hypothetical protein
LSTSKHSALADELIKYVSTTSALLGGFAFAGLTAISYDVQVSKWLIIAFGVVTSLSIGLNLLAMFLAGIARFLEKGMHTDNESLFIDEFDAAWVISLFGLGTFLVSLVLLAWIKIRVAAIPITCVVVLIMIAMVIALNRMLKKT